MRKTIVVLVFALAIISSELLATPLDTVTMSKDGYGAKGRMKIWGGGWSGTSVFAGVYMFNKTAGTGEGAYLDDGPLGGFCMDLSEEVLSGSLTYDMIMPEAGPRPADFLGGPMGAVKAAYLGELWSRFYDPLWAAGGQYTSQQNSDAEAFAAAVWEIIYEDIPTGSFGWDVTVDGTDGELGFRAEKLDYKTANSWLAALDGSYPEASLRALSYVGSQDFLVEVPIPEPATIALLSIGAMISISLRKKAA